MILTSAIALAAALPRPVLPVAMRGVWDFEGRCQLAGEDSVSRVIVRETEAVFWETVFTPKRILIPDVANWTAAGVFDEEGETSKGRLTLRLSRDGTTLRYTNWDNRVVRLVRCAGQG